MAPVEVTIKLNASDTFKAEIDDEETVECLAVVIMSMRPEIGEELKLILKGKFLKDEQVVKDLGLASTDFIAAVAKKPATKVVCDGDVCKVVPADQAQAPDTSAAGAPTPATESAEAIAARAMAAIAATRQQTAASTPAAAALGGDAPDEAMVLQLCGMGFERAQVIQALNAAFGNADRAVEYLFSGIPAVEPAPTQQPTPASGGYAGAGGLEAMIGGQLVTKSGMRPTAEALQGIDVVMLYFSAHWCPPCRQFTPMLANAFKYGSPPPNLGVVFVSNDRDEASFTQYYNEMPWMAMPFSNQARQSLGAVFGLRGIPAVVVLNAKTGATISTSGREDVSSKNFDLRACMQGWGVTPAAAVAPVPVVLGAAGPEKKAKKEEVEPGPPPLPVDDVVASAALSRIAKEPWEVQDAFHKTGMKVLNNVLSNPGEQKFRSLKRTNAALKTKILDVAENAGTELLVLAGFEASSEEMLTMSGEPDGRCSEVRNKLKAAHYSAWENQARKERDARIAEEMAKDKASAPRYYGGDGAGGGRNTYGGDRRKPSSGGG